MFRPVLEVADIFQQHGERWRQSHKGHLNLGQLKTMSAIERCRTMALGGHILQCQSCNHVHIAYNSCRNRHCPKCQASAAQRWLEARQDDLLPVDYYHVVFTIPAEVNDLAYQNKSVVYDILIKAVAKTLGVIAGDKKHLGARVGATLVLHTWGSAMTHHPHIHGIIPGGGLSDDGQRWIACRPGFFLPVRVLSRLFRRLFLAFLMKAYQDKQLHFYHQLKNIESRQAFTHWLKPLRQKEWVVYAKRPFAGPKAVLAYLSRYTHRVAIANSRLMSMDDKGITFQWKDYRNKDRHQQKVMTLPVDEFIRRFLLHILPKRFHRIRHIGLFANARRKNNITLIRQLLVEQENIPLSDTGAGLLVIYKTTT
ncbi:MAG: IS91 family transposase [gamma proteobacterium symbiont of Bathyaustriella thionipta]|nr:IS91 family transposase [gamma proteobacterium symbiont of Bathyaustriella thionipta]MCU7951204.1 IS91 family transposase [gamma proteobacterium symbiont of Bathyaustriella thionipta]MCU7954161.1 IS91 family transposase [gamma proteobacterium symbiont of Bathyaustriella thionipta]MCU7957719.1 IS91 family transposase [gamma proteobacterium symbiont of Bathyaustriella thionipta]MCU7965732.1 IS91 family transposase [gamma proteobacterium symbiont of Bathyaustriella thionipta]